MKLVAAAETLREQLASLAPLLHHSCPARSAHTAHSSWLLHPHQQAQTPTNHPAMMLTTAPAAQPACRAGGSSRTVTSTTRTLLAAAPRAVGTATGRFGGGGRCDCVACTIGQLLGHSQWLWRLVEPAWCVTSYSFRCPTLTQYQLCVSVGPG